MRRFKGFSATVAAIAAVVALPASAAPSCRAIRADDPATAANEQVDVCRRDAWIKDGAKLGNAAATGVIPGPTWDDAAPTTSVMAGGGSMFVSSPNADTGPARPAAKPTLRGTYTGPLDNLAATLYLTAPTYSALGGQYPFNVHLKVDGVTLFAESGELRVETAPAEGDVPVIRSRFALKDIHAAMEAEGLNLAPDAVHDVELTVRGHFIDSGNVVFHADSTEYPAGLIFNLEPNTRGRLPGYTEIDIFTG